MSFLNNLKMKHKLMLILFFPLASLLFFSTTAVLEGYRQSDDAKRLEVLAGLAVKMSSLVHELQKERGMTAGFLASKGERFRDELPSQRTETDKRVEEFKLFLKEFDGNGLNGEFQKNLEAAAGNLNSLNDKRSLVSRLEILPNDAIGYYTSVNASFLDSIGQISKLSRNKELANHVCAYANFLYGKEKAGVERAVMNKTFAENRFDAGAYAKASSLIAAQEVYKNVFLSMATREEKDYFLSKVKGEYIDEVSRMRKTAFDKALDGNFGVDPALWFKMKTGEINLMKDVEDKLSSDLKEKAGQIRAASGSKLKGLILITASIFIVAVASALLVTREMTASIGALRASMEELANGQGDLTRRLEVRGRDEIGDISGAFNRFLGGLKDIVIEIKSGAEQIASASVQLSATSDQMSKGMQTQTSQTSQIASAMEQMSSTVMEVATNSQTAADSARMATETAKKGGEIVTRTVEGMRRISSSVQESAKTISQLGKSSDQIGEIVAVIENIADQTNLLALNAAIESARAGEHGRGFAVVADEVRKLAERTTSATKEIAAMIKTIQQDTLGAVASMEAGTREVADGVSLAVTAGDELLQIVDAIDRVNDMIVHIASASQQQSAAAEQISGGVDGIALISRETSTGSSQTAAASQQLAMMAVDLQKMVSQFKV